MKFLYAITGAIVLGVGDWFFVKRISEAILFALLGGVIGYIEENRIRLKKK